MLTVPAAIEQFAGLGQIGTALGAYGQNLNALNQINGLAFPAYPAMEAGEPLNMDDLKWSATVDATVSQLIFSGPYLVGLQASKVYKQISELALDKSIDDVWEATANSYHLVIIARENKVIVDSTYLNINKTYLEVKAIAAQGLIAETDADQLRITANMVKNSADMLNRQVDLAEKMLKYQLGLPIEAKLELTDSLPAILGRSNLDSLILQSFNLENNITYQIMDNQEKSYNLLYKLRKTEFLPDVAGFYQHEELLNDKAFSFTPPDLVGLSVTVPIFSSGMRMSKMSQARIEYEKAKTTKYQVAEGLKMEYEQSLSAAKSARDKSTLSAENLQLSKKIYSQALIKFKNGSISSTDLTTVQNQYLNAQSEYFSATMDLLNAKNKLAKLTNLK